MTTADPHYQAAQPAYPAAPHGVDGGVDLGALLAGLWSRRRMVLGLVIAAVLIAFGFIMTMTPQYASEARILIANNETAFTRIERTGAPPPQADPQAVRSEVEVLLSRDLAARVIEKLRLATVSEFNADSARGISLAKILTMIGVKPSPDKRSVRQRVLDVYDGKLAVYSIPESRVIVVRFHSKDAGRAAELANTLSKIYIAATREAKLEATQHASKWLADRASELRTELARAERAVETFRSQAGLLRGRDSTLGTQSLTELNSQISVAAGQKSTAEARAREIRAALRKNRAIESATEVLQSGLIQALIQQRASLRRQAADLSARYLPGHPRMARIRSEIRGLDSQIKTEVRKIAQSLESQAKSAGAKVTALRTRLAQLKNRANIDGKEQIKLNALAREAKAKRDVLESVLLRLRNAAARQDVESQVAGARIISHALPATRPAFPRKLPIIALAALGALMLGFTLALLMEIFAMPASPQVAPVLHPQAAPPQPQPNMMPAAAPPMQAPPMQAPPMPASPQPMMATPPGAPPTAPPTAMSGGISDGMAGGMSVGQQDIFAHADPSPPPPASPVPPELSGDLAAPGSPGLQMPPGRLAAALGQMTPSQPPSQPQVQATAPSAPPATPPQQPVQTPAAPPWGVATAPGAAPVIGALSPVYLGAQQPLAGDGALFQPVVQAIAANKTQTGAKRFLLLSDQAVQGDVPAIIDMARVSAQSGQSTLLIDADFHSCPLAAALGRAPGAGLAELLKGEAGFSDVIFADDNGALHLMTAGLHPATALGYLSDGQLALTLDALAEVYEVILMIGGSGGDDTSIEALATQANAVIVIAQTEAEAAPAVAALNVMGQGNAAIITREAPAPAPGGFARFFRK